MKDAKPEPLTVNTPDGRPAEQQPIWRHDFPIDWPEDELRARRDFTRFLMLTSLAFAAGQFWIVMLRAFRRARGLPPLVRQTSRSAPRAVGCRSLSWALLPRSAAPRDAVPSAKTRPAGW